MSDPQDNDLESLVGGRRSRPWTSPSKPWPDRRTTRPAVATGRARSRSCKANCGKRTNACCARRPNSKTIANARGAKRKRSGGTPPCRSSAIC